MIPILIICHNNYKYVENTIKQLININKEYKSLISIIDNESTDIETKNYLDSCNLTVIKNSNNGPWISQYNNVHIYNSLPEKYIVTDPDLQFNENIPSNFIEILSLLSDQYKCEKIGFSINISEQEKFFKSYVNNDTIYNWEKQFWEKRIENNEYELYNAVIDTTFALVNKNYKDLKIRIAGNFTCKHIPWYIENPLFNKYENYILNCNTTEISTISKFVKEYTNENFHKIYKNNEMFLIEKDANDPNINFWINIFHSWENETFTIFDKFLDKNKILIDIGGWIGTTCMYGARKSKHVYVVEADKQSYTFLTKNCLLNNKNVTCINNAIYNETDIDIFFGKNKFLENSKLNDSTSQVYKTDTKDCYSIKCIRVKDLIDKYQIEFISLIKVDIEGGEEHILDDLFEIKKNFNIPLYISFHYSWWENKDLDRFKILSFEQKQSILQYPFISIIFE